MTPSEDEELEHRLENWARWKDGGSEFIRTGQIGRFSGGIEFGDYGRSTYREAKIPILSGEAQQVDAIVEALPRDRRIAIRGWYLGRLPAPPWYIAGGWTQEKLAAELGFALRTFQRLLADARSAVWSGILARRNKRAA